MALVNFTNLDFDQIKTSIRDYLRSNSNFTDYDFEGSNLSVIIDVLAYNTYISSYNANMISNEVFIDSATLRENVVSIARSIGYTPRSRTASKANISFFVDTTTSFSPQKALTVTLKKGIVATSAGSFGVENYVYSIPDDITVPVVNGIADFTDVTIYEGTYITNTFTVDSLNPNQKYILDNANIDSSLIRVEVRDGSLGPRKRYIQANNILDINSESRIFFIQEIEDQRYELIFGDGIFGKKLSNENIIDSSYIVTSGEVANGVGAFLFNGTVVDNYGFDITNGISLLTTNTAASGGREIESVDSIKKYSTRIYAAQNRAVTPSDYEAIIPQIYPEAESVSVFGGEDLDPPQYGKVFITIKPEGGFFVSNGAKDNIKSMLKKYSVAGIVPEILDLKYLSIEINSSIYYNNNNAPSSEYVSSIVYNNIQKYADSSELNKYGTRFKYSKFLGIIDQSHPAITSNITSIQMRRDLRLAVDTFAEYAIDFGNHMHVQSLSGYNIKSSAFRVLDITDDVYLFDEPIDRRTGTISLYSLQSQGSTTPVVRRRNVGAIDYVKGRITLNPINIVSGKNKDGQQIMEIFAVPHSNDVIGLQDLYLQLDTSSVEMIVDEISSGADPSGSTYKSSTSYYDVNNNPY